MTVGLAAFWIAATCYAAATALFSVHLSFGREAAARWGFAASVAGLVPHMVAMVAAWQSVGHGPFSSRHEVLSSNAFVLVSLFAISARIAPAVRRLGLPIMAASLLMMGVAAASDKAAVEVPVIFKSYWLYVHVGFAKIFGAATIASASCATGYLAHRWGHGRWAEFPSRERLDDLTYRFLLLAFFALGVMIAAGAVWAYRSWGRFWAWDPIETSSLATWLAFGVILHLRALHGWSGRRMAWLAIVSLALMIANVYVVVMMTPTIHDSYLSGSK